MAFPWLRPVPGFLLALTVLAELAAVPLSWGLEPAWDTLLLAVSSPVTTAAGALILSRHPRHPIGWLLVAQGLVAALLGDLAQGWGLRAADQGWPLGQLAEFSASASWLPTAPLGVAVLLLFPTGHLLARRWSLVLALSVIGTVLAEPGWALNPEAGEVYVAGRNPYAVDWLPTQELFVGGFAMVAVSLLAGLVAVVIRFRASSEVERLQLKWFALASAALAIGLSLGGALWWVTPIVHVVPALVVTIWPIAICVAILRYRLYDVDLVISRTVTYAILTVLLAAVYAGAVLVLGTVVGRESVWVTAGATLLAAAAFKVAHRHVQDVIDRRFRPQHHDALSVVTGFVDDLRHDRAEPEDVVDALRAAMRDPSLDLRFVLQRDEPPVDEHGRPAKGDDRGRERVAARRGGMTLGAVVWSPPQRSGPCPAAIGGRRGIHRDRDGPTSGGAAAAPGRGRRVPRPHCSRRRRRAQAPGTRPARRRPAAPGLDRSCAPARAARLAGHPEEARRTLDGAVVEVTAAIEELRALAHGLRPALLQAGLGPALRELASRSPVPVVVSATSDRFPSDVETAAYFVACEGLTNAVKHARAGEVRVEVAHQDSTLVVRVADDGVGGAAIGHGSGLSDRVAARGGRLMVDSVRGRGTTIRAELPCVP